MTASRNLRITAALAAFAAAILLVAIPSAQPVGAQQASTATDDCTTVTISSRVISETRDGNFIDQRQIEDTIVDRCTTAAGGTVDLNQRRVRYWVDVQEFDNG